MSTQVQVWTEPSGGRFHHPIHGVYESHPEVQLMLELQLLMLEKQIARIFQQQFLSHFSKAVDIVLRLKNTGLS
jgi:hypothetical protein